MEETLTPALSQGERELLGHILLCFWARTVGSEFVDTFQLHAL